MLAGRAPCRPVDICRAPGTIEAAVLPSREQLSGPGHTCARISARAGAERRRMAQRYPPTCAGPLLGLCLISLKVVPKQARHRLRQQGTAAWAGQVGWGQHTLLCMLCSHKHHNMRAHGAPKSCAASLVGASFVVGTAVEGQRGTVRKIQC